MDRTFLVQGNCLLSHITRLENTSRVIIIWLFRVYKALANFRVENRAKRFAHFTSFFFMVVTSLTYFEWL